MMATMTVLQMVLAIYAYISLSASYHMVINSQNVMNPLINFKHEKAVVKLGKQHVPYMPWLDTLYLNLQIATLLPHCNDVVLDGACL